MCFFSILSYPGYILFLSVRKWSDEGIEKEKGTGPLCGGPERRFSFKDWQSWRCGHWEWQGWNRRADQQNWITRLLETWIVLHIPGAPVELIQKMEKRKKIRSWNNKLRKKDGLCNHPPFVSFHPPFLPTSGSATFTAKRLKMWVQCLCPHPHFLLTLQLTPVFLFCPSFY